MARFEFTAELVGFGLIGLDGGACMDGWMMDGCVTMFVAFVSHELLKVASMSFPHFPSHHQIRGLSRPHHRRGWCFQYFHLSTLDPTR